MPDLTAYEFFNYGQIIAGRFANGDQVRVERHPDDRKTMHLTPRDELRLTAERERATAEWKARHA